MKRPLRILMLCPQFYPLVAGYERAAERLAQGLVERGQRVDVVTERRDPSWPLREQLGGVGVRRIRCVYRRGLHSLSSVLSLGVFLLLHTRRYDVLHVHQYGAWAAVAVAAGKLLRRPVVLKITNTGDRGIDAELPHSLLGRASRALHRHVDACVTTSERARDEAAAFGIPSARIHRIPNPLPTDHFAPPAAEVRTRLRAEVGCEGCFVALSVSRLRHEKNHRMLIEAWTALAKGRDDVRLVILGEGEMRESIEAQVAASPAASTIRLLGEVVDPLPWYQRADVFVLASNHEGLSNSLMEAMSCGLPVVSTRVSGSEDVFAEAKVGQLVEVGDGAAFTRALASLEADAEQRRSAGQAARAYAEGHYALSAVVRATLAMYTALSGAEGRGRAVEAAS